MAQRLWPSRITSCPAQITSGSRQPSFFKLASSSSRSARARGGIRRSNSASVWRIQTGVMAVLLGHEKVRKCQRGGPISLVTKRDQEFQSQLQEKNPRLWKFRANFLAPVPPVVAWSPDHATTGVP